VDLQLSDEDRAFQREMREFFRQAVSADIREAVLARRELTREQVVEAHQVLNAAGLAVPHWPVEWGGRDWSDLRRHLWHEEMQLAGVPIPYGLNSTMAGPVIAEFGTEEQKLRFLPATANLDIWWAQGFSEPGAGSDLAAVRTTARRDGDHWVVNGQKTWTTYAPYADWMFTLVRTDPGAARPQAGLSFVFVDMRSPGITIRPIELIDGSVEVNEVFLDDVVVHSRDLLGEENRGWSYAKFLLGNERVGVAPVGATKALLAAAKSAAKDLLDDPAVRARFAHLETRLLALEVTALRVAAASTGGEAQPVSSILKVVGTEIRQDVTELVLDLAGPGAVGGFADDQEWERIAAPAFLNYRKASIYGGSNEIQRMIIARSILGLGA
jgi:alkylation response protein AidB-like acyl-CoA dehydrogenase